jgi:hypothetical protein
MDKIVERQGDIIFLTTPYHKYQYNAIELVKGELQGTLGYVIASAFIGPDRNTGKLTMSIYKDAIRQIL